MMRIEKALSALLMAALCLAAFAAAAEPVGPDAEGIAPYLGNWAGEGVTLEVLGDDGDPDTWACRLVREDGGARDIWEYATCRYDAAEGALVCAGCVYARERDEALFDGTVREDWWIDDLTDCRLALSADGAELTVSGVKDLDGALTLRRAAAEAAGE